MNVYFKFDKYPIFYNLISLIQAEKLAMIYFEQKFDFFGGNKNIARFV